MIDPTPYAVLRVAYGLVMMADVIHLYAHWGLFLPTAAWPSFPVRLICLVWVAALGGLIVGFRPAVAVNWICCTVMLGLAAPNQGFQQAAVDSVIIGISFLYWCCPSSKPGTDALYLPYIWRPSTSIPLFTNSLLRCGLEASESPLL